jgi:preprotein translocase subunit Sss1
VAYIHQRPIMNRRIDPLISASRGTLAGDLLWLGAIGFIIAIITGMIR